MIPWTVAWRTPLSMDLSKQEYWGGSLLQGIFPTQLSNLCPQHWQADSSPCANREAQGSGEDIWSCQWPGRYCLHLPWLWKFQVNLLSPSLLLTLLRSSSNLKRIPRLNSVWWRKNQGNQDSNLLTSVRLELQRHETLSSVLLILKHANLPWDLLKT